MKAPDPLAAKRKAIVDAILATRQAKLEALQANPGLDVSIGEIMNSPSSRAEITRDVARLTSRSVDQLYEHYCGAALPRYCW